MKKLVINKGTGNAASTLLAVHSTFFNGSETFIYRQVVYLSKRFKITLAAKRFVDGNFLPVSQQSRFIIPAKSTRVDRLLSLFIKKLTGRTLPFGVLGKYSLKRFVQRQMPDVIHAHFGGTGVELLPIARNAGIPLAVSFHGKDASSNLRDPSYKNRLPTLFDYASAIVLCSPHMIEKLNLEKWMEKVRIIPYGVDVKEFFPAVRNPDGALKILHVGRLVPKKGVPDLIRAFVKLSRDFEAAELHIIGDGREIDICKDLVHSQGLLSKVFFYGLLSIDKVKIHMQECDVFVLNSRTDESGDMEGLPNVLLEAMCCGVAVVSTRHAGIPMAVEHEVSGLLVEENNNEELYQALRRLCSDMTLRKQLGSKARERIVSQFSIEKMGDSLTELFLEIISRGKR